MNRENRQKWQAEAVPCTYFIDAVVVHLDPNLWMSCGSTKFIPFSDTNADATRGVFRQHQDGQRIYGIVDIPA